MERTLTALLYRRDARAALAARDFGRLGLAGDAAAIAAFAALDLRELEASAALVRQMLLARRYRGTGGLVDWYPRTLAAWRAAHANDASLDELAASFLESPHAEAWREGVAGEPGQCLEEAFYRFACARGLGDAASRKDEWLTAQLRALALCPEPAFTIPDELTCAPGGGWFAVAGAADAPILYAAVRGRFIRGGLSPALAALLRGEAPAAGAPEEVRARLVELGLW
jgi:hypothetical protein